MTFLEHNLSQISDHQYLGLQSCIYELSDQNSAGCLQARILAPWVLDISPLRRELEDIKTFSPLYPFLHCREYRSACFPSPELNQFEVGTGFSSRPDSHWLGLLCFFDFHPVWIFLPSWSPLHYISKMLIHCLAKADYNINIKQLLLSSWDSFHEPLKCSEEHVDKFIKSAKSTKSRLFLCFCGWTKFGQ